MSVVESASLTEAQARSLGEMMQRYLPSWVEIGYRPAGFESGTVVFVLQRADGSLNLAGSISPDGKVGQ